MIPECRYYGDESDVISSAAFFTIGHSTHQLPDFLALLQRHEVKALADIRRLQQYGQESLLSALQAEDIRYHWLEVLGGRRRSDPDTLSPNHGLRNESFRAYGEYMLTAEFRGGIEQLLQIAREQPAAYMCAEALYWQCHRRLVSAYLTAHGHIVEHILPSGELQPHQLTAGAQYKNGRLTYPSANDVQKRLFD